VQSSEKKDLFFAAVDCTETFLSRFRQTLNIFDFNDECILAQLQRTNQITISL